MTKRSQMLNLRYQELSQHATSIKSGLTFPFYTRARASCHGFRFIPLPPAAPRLQPRGLLPSSESVREYTCVMMYYYETGGMQHDSDDVTSQWLLPRSDYYSSGFLIFMYVVPLFKYHCMDN
jgi:hypothetical protein